MNAEQSAGSEYPVTRHYDEAFTAEGELRPAYRDLLGSLDRGDLDSIRDDVRSRLEADGVEFGPAGERSTYTVDPIPRIVTADQWAELSAGLIQRARALQMFLADIYSGQEIISSGVMRKSILDRAPHYEPEVAGFDSPVIADLLGPDLVRDEQGFRVLEDNLRYPSGFVFADAARQAVAGRWPAGCRPPANDGIIAMLGEMLRAKDPRATGDPAVAILSEGPGSAVWFEHRALADRLEVPVVTPSELEVSGDSLIARSEDGTIPVEVLYNRSDTDRLSDDEGGLTPLGEILIGPLRAGTLACVNSFGAGIADDKAVHSYTPEMIRFYLGEEPLVPIPETYDLGDPEQAGAALPQLDRLVIKPRWELGGRDIVIGPKATATQLEKARQAIRENPDGYVAQEMIELSTHPTVVDDALEPRHLDLRPFVITSGEEVKLAPLALSRFARAAGEMVVNSTQGGGAKDTWILDR